MSKTRRRNPSQLFTTLQRRVLDEMIERATAERAFLTLKLIHERGELDRTERAIQDLRDMKDPPDYVL